MKTTLLLQATTTRLFSFCQRRRALLLTLLSGGTFGGGRGGGIEAMVMTTTTSTNPDYSASGTIPKIIDSHLHVWANGDESTLKKSGEESAPYFPFASGKDPPGSLLDAATPEMLLKRMDESGVDGALIVQPINHGFDHSYVLEAKRKHPKRFKIMMLHDPSQSTERALEILEDLCGGGGGGDSAAAAAAASCVGVRFNPYLWPKKSDEEEEEFGSSPWTPISSTDAGVAVYKRCGELGVPVGIMCFQGLHWHYDDILKLLELSPQTKLVIDHFGFTALHHDDDDDDDDDKSKNDSFSQLLSLSEYPQVFVKISALFRMVKQEADPKRDDENDDQHRKRYEKLKTERFLPLLEAYGPDRLMFGTDFPFVLEQPESYKGTVEIVKSWMMEGSSISGAAAAAASSSSSIMGATAERLFGPW